MRPDGLAAAIQEVSSQFEVVLPTSEEHLDQVFRLRHQVYCLERGFEQSIDGRETDRFDAFSLHALVRHRASARAVGTVRLVVPAANCASPPLPMVEACDSEIINMLPHGGLAEISRFALSKQCREEMKVSDSVLRLFLMRGIVALSGQLDLTHWCALMEPSLLRLLRASAIHFRAIGPLVEHHGLRQPSVGAISEVLGRMEREQPLIWDFITDGGTLWHERQFEYAA